MSQERNKLQIWISARTEQLQAGMAKGQAAVQKFTLGAAATLAAVSGLTTALVALVKSVIQTGLEFAKTRAQLDALAGSTQAANGFIRAAQAGMDGLANRMEASEVAFSLLNMRMVTTTDEMEELVRQIFIVTNGNVEAARSFSTLISNQATLRLDTYGLRSIEVSARIKELQAATAGMSREEAFNIAVKEALAVKAEELAGSFDNLGASAERVSVTLEDLKIDAGEASNALLAMAENNFSKLIPSFLKASEAGIQLENVFTLLIAAQQSIYAAAQEVDQGLYSQSEYTARVVANFFDIATELGAISTPLSREAEAAAADAAGALLDQASAIDEVAASIDNLRKSAAAPGQLGMEDFFNAFNAGMEQVGGALTGLVTTEGEGPGTLSDEEFYKMVVSRLQRAGADPELIYNFRLLVGLTTEAEAERERLASELVNAAARGDLSAADLAAGFQALRGGETGTAQNILNNIQPGTSIDTRAQGGTGGDISGPRQVQPRDTSESRIAPGLSRNGVNIRISTETSGKLEAAIMEIAETAAYQTLDSVLDSVQ